jgi:dTDP-4-dehydrorhamnose 3,5-epimerase
MSVATSRAHLTFGFSLMLAWTGEVQGGDQSGSYQGVRLRLQGRSGTSEAKLVRSANGALLDLVVDARPRLATFGRVMSFLLDDPSCTQPCVPEQAWSNRRNARGAESTGLREPAATLPRLLCDKGVDNEVMFLGE